MPVNPLKRLDNKSKSLSFNIQRLENQNLELRCLCLGAFFFSINVKASFDLV